MLKVEEKKISNHVIPTYHRDGWAVRKSSASRASRVFKTQEEAIAYGVIVSNAQKIPLYVHKLNGMVASKITPWIKEPTVKNKKSNG
jgi:hypothetical protein